MAHARNPIFPDVPTLKEALGVDYSTSSWRGIGGPRGLPPEIAATLTVALKKVYDSSAFKDFMTGRGFGTVWRDAGQFRNLHGPGGSPDGSGHEGGRFCQGVMRFRAEPRTRGNRL